MFIGRRDGPVELVLAEGFSRICAAPSTFPLAPSTTWSVASKSSVVVWVRVVAVTLPALSLVSLELS